MKLFLRLAALAENACDLDRQICFSKHLVRIREPQISKNVSAAFRVIAFSHVVYPIPREFR